MVKCKKCGAEKPLSDYYVSNKSVCKECVKARVRENRAENLDRYRAYDKARANNPERVNARAEYVKTERGKELATKAKRAYIERNPKKRAVHITTGNAIRDGYLIKGCCEVCGTSENICAHHCDYDKPLDVMWLCARHHADWHAEHGEALNAN